MRLLRPLAALLLALSIAACARAQSQPQADFPPPAKKPLDAKTQLETGRKY
jgi:hypothetical protein